MSQPPDIQPPWPPMMPMPVEPISYSSAGATGRPGVIAAIGVISIVVASLSILTSGFTSLINFGFLMAAQNSRAFSASPASSKTTTSLMTSTKTGGITTYNYSVGGGSGGITTGSPAPITEMLGDKGVVAADRRIIIDGLTEVRPLTEARQRQFDELLAENGKDITPFTGSSLTSSRVAANVSDSGRFPTAAGGSDGPDYFVLGQGRVEVTDDHAVFFPADGGAAIRTVAEAVPEGNDSATAASTAKSNALPPAQIRSALRRVKQLGGRLNKSQTQALTQTLQNPGEQFIIATTDGSDPATEISAASTFADGSVFIQTLHNGMTSTITFDPTGSVTSSMSNTYSSATSGMPQFSLLTALLAMIGSILNLVLGVYLLICGILILRQSGKRCSTGFTSRSNSPSASQPHSLWPRSGHSFLNPSPAALAREPPGCPSPPPLRLFWV